MERKFGWSAKLSPFLKPLTHDEQQPRSTKPENQRVVSNLSFFGTNMFSVFGGCAGSQVNKE